MRHALLSLVFVALALAGCTGPVIMGADAIAIVATKPGDLPPADTRHQIPPHESWCYHTLGEVQCYPHAQDIPAERLINVEPQNLYPLDLQAYRQAVERGKAATAPPPIAAAPQPLPPVVMENVEKMTLLDAVKASLPRDTHAAPAKKKMHAHRKIRAKKRAKKAGDKPSGSVDSKPEGILIK